MAVPNRIAERERVKRLVDLVADRDLPVLARVAQALAAEDRVIAAFENAPEDDEGELTDEMIARLAKSRQEAAEGRVVSHEEARRRRGL